MCITITILFVCKPLCICQGYEKKTQENQSYEILNINMFRVYLNRIIFFNFRPNRIKVSTDELRQKAEKKEFQVSQLIKTTCLLSLKNYANRMSYALGFYIV